MGCSDRERVTEQAVQPSNESNPSKVLIVDDNIQNLELLEAYLEGVPEISTLRATGGAEALDAVREHRPELILLDIMMPKMSGYEVCKKLRADPATADIGIIMVTALNEFADVERGTEVGTDDFVSKPVNRHELIARVRKVLDARRQRLTVAPSAAQ